MNNSGKEIDQKIDGDLERVKADLEHVREAEDLLKAGKEHLKEDLEKLKRDEHQPKKDEVIFIDGKEYKSRNLTTGKALYILGSVDAQSYDLYEEVRGKGDDKFVADNDEPIHTYDCERFYSAQKNLNPGG